MIRLHSQLLQLCIKNQVFMVSRLLKPDQFSWFICTYQYLNLILATKSILFCMISDIGQGLKPEQGYPKITENFDFSFVMLQLDFLFMFFGLLFWVWKKHKDVSKQAYSLLKVKLHHSSKKNMRGQIIWYLESTYCTCKWF